MANKYSIQIKCFQTIDVDGIEDQTGTIWRSDQWGF